MVGHPRLIRSLFAVFCSFFAALAGAHSIPEIPVHGRFQADGTAEISIEINPRSWAPSPAEAPSLEQRAWARLTAEQRAELLRRAREHAAAVAKLLCPLLRGRL